jgi:hypothetical protein
MSFEDYIVKVRLSLKLNLACQSLLVDMALGQRMESSSFDLNAKPLDSLDVDERPPPIMKLANTHAYVTKLRAKPEKLNKIYVANLKWQYE